MFVSLVNADRTGFVSIQTEALLECQVLSADELATALEGFSRKSGSIGLSSEIEYHWEEFTPSLRKIRTQYPEIASWIEFQHHAMTELASQLNSQRAMLSDAHPQTISICASGVEFYSALQCAVGDSLEIILSLGRGMPTILLVGLVDDLSVSDISEHSDTPQNLLKVTFTHIRESDQEILIRHIHRAQLNEIRSARAGSVDAAKDG